MAGTRNRAHHQYTPLGRNGELRQDHAYITAVVALYERLHARDYFDELAERERDRAHAERISAIFAGQQNAPPGLYLFTHTYVPGGASAEPLGDVFFRGPRDLVLEYSYDEQRYLVAYEGEAAPRA